MKRMLCGLAGLVVLGLAMASLDGASAAEEKKDDKKSAKTLTIKEIMGKAHKKGGALEAVETELKGKDVKWETIETKAKDLLLLAGDLAMNNPPKGEKTSWEKLTKEYTDHVQMLQKAAESKSIDQAKAEQKSLRAMCNTCHTAHRGK